MKIFVKRHIARGVVFLTGILFLSGVSNYALAGGGAGYSITAFNISFCGSSFPTAYQTVSFSLNETVVGCFKKSQTNASLVLTLPTGFEFNTGAGTASYTSGNDITNVTLSSLTTSSVTVLVTTDASAGMFDDIQFNNFQIRATSSPASGILARSGGTFVVDNQAGNPTSLEPFGTLDSQSPMVWDATASTVETASSGAVDVTQGAVKQEMLKIIIVTQNACTPLIAEKFCFDTDGANGTGSDNPTTNISKAQVWYSGTSGLFADASTLYGELSSVNGSFKIAGSPDITLAVGTNYFWLTYDIPLSANNGQLLDARLDSIMVSGVLKMTEGVDFLDLNPTGSRTIVAPTEFYSITLGNWTTGTTWSTTDGGATCNCIPTAVGQVYVSHNVTVNAVSTVSGLIIRAGGILQGTKSLTITNSLSTAGSGYLNYASPISIGGNFELVGTGASTTSDEIDIATNLNIGVGTSLAMTGGNPAGTRDLKVAGSFINNGTLTLNNKDIYLDGGATIISGSGTINSTGGSLIVNAGDKTIQAGSNLNINVVFSISGAYTITNSGTVTMTANITGSTGSSTWSNGSGATLNTSAVILATGTLSASGSGNTIVYNGAAQTVKSGNYYNLTVQGGSTKTLGGTITVNGNLSIVSGTTLSASSYTLNLYGNWSNSGDFLEGTGTVVFKGATNLSSSATEIFNNFQVDGGSTVTVPVGSAITVNGTVTNNGTITLKSPTSDGPGASWIDAGTIIGSGTFVVERYVTGGRWWYVSPPVSGETSTVYNAADASRYLYYYNEPTGWVSIPGNGTSLGAMTGYMIYSTSGAFTLNFTGTVNTGSRSFGTTKTVGSPSPGWTMTKNPYPSAIDWDAASGWTKTNIRNTVYVKKSGVLESYNGVTKVGTNGGTRYIAACQAIWVKDTLGGGTLGMTNAVRVHDKTTLIKDYKAPLSNILRLTVDNGSVSDESVLYFTAGASQSFEKRDTEKNFGTASIPHLYFKSSDGTKLAVNSKSDADLSAEVIEPIAFIVSVAGTYTITATDLGTFDPSLYIYLVDNDLGITQYLNSDPTYTFTSGAIDTYNRFQIIISPSPLPVELLSFNARYNGHTVDLDWETASEQNNAFFTVERSDDGIRFNEISTVRGAGNSNHTISYYAEDENPLAGLSYYRLKQTDYNSEYSYSKIVAVNCDEGSVMSIYPNPTSGSVMLLIENISGRFDFIVTDVTGSIVCSESLQADDSNFKDKFDLSRLGKGVYYVQIKNESQTQSKRLIIE